MERARPEPVKPHEGHLHSAISWIKRAQDASGSGGVSWGYRMRRPVRTALPVGWIAPYPETTGYIIPTMLRYAGLCNDAESLERARSMGLWEMQIQLHDGGIQGGIYGAQPVASSTFVTGQVLFGFTAGYVRFSDPRFRAAALRAGEWLLSCLDEGGRFTRGYSHFCAPGAKAYEARTGLALAAAGEVVGRDDFGAAASRMANYALRCQRENGWFDENDLDRHEAPLTHTIGYVLEGLHGLGIRLGRADCLAAVDQTLTTIVPLIRDDGFLAGRWYRDWTPAADWACLTGSAQIAGVFLRRYCETRNAVYFDAGRKLLGFVCFTQDLKPGFPGIDGGIRGSYPVQGNYGQWCVLNWATKFFADSVMDYLAASTTT
ncbi:MAG: hypothetical protein JOZ62_07840 [Acidobacteriaceae bacterium]|nr:hypothetical protein [Acidobacteriaceae bacterium]